MEALRESGVPWLVKTKLRPPQLLGDLIERHGLLAALHDAVVSHPLTLVSAPAGYGKTTLLATLPHAFPDLPIAWLSLDQGDDEPASFLAALIGALRRLNPASGSTAQTVLDSLSAPRVEARRVIGVLINDILESLPDPFALVFDDLHLITEPAVYAAMDYLLEHLPPQMHVVVSGRQDPPLSLARLRARGQMAELRFPNLRFTLDEAAAFLNDRLRMDLSSEDLASLYNRTEGWAAGLRLLADSLGNISTNTGRTAFINHLCHTDRHVFDFLADEVLDRQSPTVRTFLLETSILPELGPELCRAVTYRADAPALLEDVYRRNFFLVEVAAETSTAYRYHHLFAEFLRRRLARETPELVAELHRRAAEAESIPTRAIAHYVAAELWEQAAKAMEQVGDQLVQEGLCHVLRGCIQALPACVLEARPRLLYFLGVCALRAGALEEARSALERAERGFQAVGDEAGQGEALLGLVGVASQQHDYDSQATLTRRALTYPLPPHGRVQLLMARVWQSYHQGDMHQAGEDLDQALQVAGRSADHRASHVLAPILRMHLALLSGRAEQLERHCRQALARFGEGVGLVQAGAHSLLGYLHLLCGRTAEAAQQAERARVMSQQLGGFTFLDVEVGFVLTSVSLIRGDWAAAERYWEARLPWIEKTPALKFYAASILHFILRAQWMQGRVDQVQLTYTRMSNIVDPHELSEVRVSRTLARALAELGEGRYADAERMLRPAVQLEQETRPWFVFGSARLLLAHLYVLWQRPRDALRELAPVLAECERDGMPGLILQEGAIVVPLLRLAVERGVHATFAACLLDLLDTRREAKPVRVPETGETLSPREVQVLGLIARGASNQEIAQQLVVSKHTVKVHVTNILGKLRASSRTQAAARARELRLL